MQKNFISELHDFIKRNQNNDWRDNWDMRRFGALASPNMLEKLKMQVKSFLKQIVKYRATRLMRELNRNASSVQWIYEHFGDDESRRTLVDVIAYRMLGHRKVKLQLNTGEYWNRLSEIERRQDGLDSIDMSFMGWQLHKIDMRQDGYPFSLYSRPSSVYAQLILQQYRCVLNGRSIEVRPGDVVIDAGGCYGDTALYFAYKCGDAGMVYSFEFMPGNLEIFRKNLDINPGLAGRIQVIPNPLWSHQGEELYVEGSGPGARVTTRAWGESSQQVLTASIDDFISERNLQKVDFIKMDIEGAEGEALKGAENTIRRFKPRLAISVYHNLQDYWKIAMWIDSLGLDYKFYLRHFTIHAEESVLFAV